MGNGGNGNHGQNALRNVDLEREAGIETVTTLLQLMEAKNVQDQAKSQESATQMLVQVKTLKLIKG